MGISVYPAPSSAKTLKVVRYTTPGESTFTLPSGYGAGNPLVADVTIVGAGGGAGRGHYTSSTNYGVGGGGGGGGYFKQTVQFTENMNVRVGRGGASANWYHQAGINQGLGGQGGCSYISSSRPVNYFINPHFYGVYDQFQIEAPFVPVFYTTDAVGVPAGVSSASQALYTSRWNDTAYHSGPTFDVKPSTNYCFSAYFYASAASTFTIFLTWLDADGAWITSTSATGQSISNTWTSSRKHAGATSPSNAAYCRIMLQRTAGTAGSLYIYAPMFEEGVTTPSTYVDGDSTGYSYAKGRANSVTIANSATTYLASGGGGGAGHITTTYAELGRKGLPGASSGGGGFWTTSTIGSEGSMYGGHGGGAGGHATPQTEIWEGVISGVTSQVTWGRRKNQTFGRLSEFGEGSEGNLTNPASSGYTQTFSGNPGIGIDGYGRGGFGAFTTSGGVNAWSSNTELAKMVNAVNPGQGGSSIIGYDGASSVGYSGMGGHGLVIISYWE